MSDGTSSVSGSAPAGTLRNKMRAPGATPWCDAHGWPTAIPATCVACVSLKDPWLGFVSVCVEHAEDWSVHTPTYAAILGCPLSVSRTGTAPTDAYSTGGPFGTQKKQCVVSNPLRSMTPRVSPTPKLAFPAAAAPTISWSPYTVHRRMRGRGPTLRISGYDRARPCASSCARVGSTPCAASEFGPDGTTWCAPTRSRTALAIFAKPRLCRNPGANVTVSEEQFTHLELCCGACTRWCVSTVAHASRPCSGSARTRPAAAAALRR